MLGVHCSANQVDIRRQAISRTFGKSPKGEFLHHQQPILCDKFSVSKQPELRGTTHLQTVPHHSIKVAVPQFAIIINNTCISMACIYCDTQKTAVHCLLGLSYKVITVGEVVARAERRNHVGLPRRCRTFIPSECRPDKVLSLYDASMLKIHHMGSRPR